MFELLVFNIKLFTHSSVLESPYIVTGLPLLNEFGLATVSFICGITTTFKL